MTPDKALQIAKDAYASSTSYVDSNYRKQWQDDIRLFQSKHPEDSKYNSEAYKFRSRIFRPKTRASVRKNEAAVSNAFFSNIDVVNIDASNDKNPVQVYASKFYKELLQYRLTKSIPWFLTCIGAFQDATTVGVCCSYQYWKYREKKIRKALVSENGMPVMGIDGKPMYQEQSEVIEDKPCIELIPVENLRIDKGACWIDPINSSPYVIHLIPMYLSDVRLMKEGNEKTGEEGWDIPEDGKLVQASKLSFDPTRQIREEKREDSKEGAAFKDYEIIWIHKNIVREDGEDFCYYTAGTEHLLTKPKPLKDLYWHGERPYVMGYTVIETHKPYPQGLVGLGRELQKEANEIANQRLDNVKLVLNKRFFGKRGAQIDLKALMRNVPGGVILMQNPKEDVIPVDYQDVTSSSYAEQDRLNVDFDELIGNFSSGSVMTNRKMNETVGGMNLMASGAGQMTDYSIRTFSETWAEPVLRQILKLEKHYETDENIILLMGDKIEAPVTDEMFNTDVELTVNVGIGATNPNERITKLVVAAKSYTEIALQASQVMGTGLNVEEFGKEIFGAVGYRDGGRFIEENSMGQMLQQAQMQMQQMQEQIQEQMQAMEKIKQLAMTEIEKRDNEIKMLEDSLRDTDTEQKRIELEARIDEAQIKRETEQIKSQAAIRQAEAEAQKEIELATIEADRARHEAVAKSVDAIAKNVEKEQGEDKDSELDGLLKQLMEILALNQEQQGKAIDILAEMQQQGNDNTAKLLMELASMKGRKKNITITTPEGERYTAEQN